MYYTDNIDSEYFDELIEAIHDIKSRKNLRDFLQGILTPIEIKELSMRLQIILMLKNGFPHLKIAKLLGVGIATVTRGSKELHKGRFSYLEYYAWR